MFEIFRNQSKSAAGAILYVTIGVLMIIWAGLWYGFYIYPASNPPTWQKFTCVGTILSGFAIGGIGLLFGSIGRGAKAADTTISVAATTPTVPVVAANVSPANGIAAGSAASPVSTVPADSGMYLAGR